jgi:catechol 2,3-dioxygenase
MSSAKEFAANPIGTFFEAEKLVAARDAGLSFQEIHERTRAGEYLPEVIPEDIFLPEVW